MKILFLNRLHKCVTASLKRKQKQLLVHLRMSLDASVDRLNESSDEK